MRGLLYSMIVIVGASLLPGCRAKEDNTRELNAVALFERSRYATRLYTDSLGLARDSATVLRLSKDLEDEITRLNYSFPSETYLGMTEGANDTLIRLTDRFAALRDSLLRRFGEAPADTATLSQNSEVRVISE